MAHESTAGTVAELPAVIASPALSSSVVNDSAAKLTPGCHRNGVPGEAHELTREVTIDYGAVAELPRTVTAPTLYRSVGQ